MKLVKFEPALWLLALIIYLGPALAFDIRPDPDSTEGLIRIDGHSREAVCDRSKNHRDFMSGAS
jgi:hypothetical protein